MLKIVYPNCCGIDVHKTFVVAVIAITDDQGITQYYRRWFSTFTNQLKELKKWLNYYSCFHVCMESTGKYWILFVPRQVWCQQIMKVLERNIPPKFLRVVATLNHFWCK